MEVHTKTRVVERLRPSSPRDGQTFSADSFPDVLFIYDNSGTLSLAIFYVF